MLNDKGGLKADCAEFASTVLLGILLLEENDGVHGFDIPTKFVALNKPTYISTFMKMTEK